MIIIVLYPHSPIPRDTCQDNYKMQGEDLIATDLPRPPPPVQATARHCEKCSHTDSSEDIISPFLSIYASLKGQALMVVIEAVQQRGDDWRYETRVAGKLVESVMDM